MVMNTTEKTKMSSSIVKTFNLPRVSCDVSIGMLKKFFSQFGSVEQIDYSTAVNGINANPSPSSPDDVAYACVSIHYTYYYPVTDFQRAINEDGFYDISFNCDEKVVNVRVFE